MSVDRCVCCGDVIPEGRQVCPKCERTVCMSKPKMYGAFAPYTPNNKQDIRYRRKAASTATIPGCCKERGVSAIKREDGFCDKRRTK